MFPSVQEPEEPEEPELAGIEGGLEAGVEEEPLFFPVVTGVTGAGTGFPEVTGAGAGVFPVVTGREGGEAF